ncbi:MAG: HflK protein [Devosia sp.]|uniref:FtsH protease activity modulator HflK n=1 Tax=Devosia sp. TaxID=1871048 RepID=UPI0026218931|nr:FtsH protease activity modulator HflK [Devosia sp.]MDB5541456.1 HflK protein [Devosia sp.]
MPWDNNTGGGGRNSNNGGPWGQTPGGGGGGRRGGTPNLEEILSRGRDQLQGGMPGARWIIVGVAAALVVFWLINSIYTIDPQEVGVETTFGKPSDQLSTSGLHFLWWPVQTVERVSVTENKTEIGSSTSRTGRSDDGVMLTSDQNIVSVKFAVLWTIEDPKAYLFNVKDPDDMVRAAGESAMREVVGRSPAQEIFRSDRAGIQTEVQQIIQTILDSYKVGVHIDQITIENVAPPAEVADAFAEVQRAQQDQQKYQEDARNYANTLLGNANGQAAAIREDAAAYKNRVVQEAEGEAARFTSVYEQYAKAPEVTRKRLYLETMEQVLGDSTKVIVEPGSTGSGVLPYLPLPALQSAPAPAATTSTTPAGGN